MTRRLFLLAALGWATTAAASCPTDLAPALAARLAELEAALGRPLQVNSGVRCPGREESEHFTGEAVDVHVADSRTRYEVLKLALPLFNRIGIGDTFLHLGVSPTHPQQVVWLYS